MTSTELVASMKQLLKKIGVPRPYKIKLFLIGWLPLHVYRLYESICFWRSHKSEFANWRSLAVFGRVPLVAKFSEKNSVYKISTTHPLIEARWRDGRRLLVPSNGAEILATTRLYLDKFNLNLAGKVCVDIGAHVGSVAVELAGRGATVYAFEPDPKNFKILEANRHLNHLSNLHSFEMAVASETGRKIFAVGPSSTSGALADAATSIISRDDSPTIAVDAISLKDIFARNGISDCELLKMDCEGGEYEILMNLEKPMFDKIKNILLEIHPFRDCDKYTLISRLKDMGYSYREMRSSESGCLDAYFSKSC